MSTADSQVAARALFHVLVNGSLQALRNADATLASIDGEQRGERLLAALPADTPREVRNLLASMAHEGSLDQLPGVVKAFERYLGGEAPRELAGEIISAVELDAAQQERINADLRARYGEELTLSFGVDPSLIGGLIIRIGDQVLDNSLRTRLSAVQRNMAVG